ncbi:MAG: hypothetical protein K2P45_04230 [Eubacterium sp.]|nr:hypothetical protein [Eubacterium sp.]
MANRIHDAFENVTADSETKEATRRFLAEKRRKKPNAFFAPPVRRVLAAVCVMAVVLLGVGGYAGYSWMLAPVSYVSIDVNPSVELVLNRIDRVVSTAAYNPEGEELLDGLSLRGKTYLQAIEQIAASDIIKKYLSSDEELVLTVAADGKKERVLTAGVERSCRHIGHGSRSVSVDLSVAEQAHGNGLSIGKYSAYLQLSQYDESVTVEECRHMSMAQIHSRIIEHEHGGSHQGESAEENTNGHGTGMQEHNEHSKETDQSSQNADQSSQNADQGSAAQDHEQDTEQSGHGQRHGRDHGNHE